MPPAISMRPATPGNRPWTSSTTSALPPTRAGAPATPTQMNSARGSRLAAEEGFYPPAHLIGPLRRFWALVEERIILASALMAHLRKHINAQRLRLSTCKAGALRTELRPRVFPPPRLVLRVDEVLTTARRPTTTTIQSQSTAQRT